MIAYLKKHITNKHLFKEGVWETYTLENIIDHLKLEEYYCVPDDYEEHSLFYLVYNDMEETCEYFIEGIRINVDYLL